MTLSDVIASFTTTPFLFVGSGISQRYYKLPDWLHLLKHFAEEVKPGDKFAYSSYLSAASAETKEDNNLPFVATLIQRDYDAKWFGDSTIRHASDSLLSEISENGLSPFKAEISQFIADNSILQHEYDEEISKLTALSNKNIAGIITTNYDHFFEERFSGYKSYIGQDSLLLSSTLGIAEIYKIHGDIAEPHSIVINSTDYQNLHTKSKYLAAKLMTLFMEYPIIFMGYSINDRDIQKILSDIAQCLTDEKLIQLADHFIFIEWDPSSIDPQITSMDIILGNKAITMTKIQLNSFLPLYNALSQKRTRIPVRLLRHFKEEIYSFTLSNTPASSIIVGELNDSRISDDNLAIYIGTRDKVRSLGFDYYDINSIIEDILFDDKPWLMDSRIFDVTFPRIKSRSGLTFLPVYKYLDGLKKNINELPDDWKIIRSYQQDKISNSNLETYAKSEPIFSSLDKILKKHPDHTIRQIACIIKSREALPAEDIHQYLIAQHNNEAIWEKNISYMKKLVALYDYKKFNK